ncbi:hypothetical protein M3Y99_01176100 [Aphelenchoides fujianensis]|nr:hypothetical protein M3Y99_01176100 [Aphelenchoides fujianensis]
MSSEESGDAMSPSVAESCSLYASPPGTKFTFDVDTLPQSQRFSNRIAQAVINTRCSDRCKFALSVVLGCLATCMQVPGIFLLNWVIVYEPRAVNQTDDQGELMEAPFVYNLGYFGACRSPFENIENLTAYKNLDPEAVRADFPRLCVLNPFFTEDDLSDFSLAANLILQRLAVPALLHIPGTVLCSIAVLLSIAGELKRDRRTIIAAMFFISGGLIIFVAVLQVICAVDDEMAPRLKTNAAGEPSLFHYHYGPSFLSASLSFLPLQMCVYLQTSSYFARFPLPFDKSVVVPGLSQMKLWALALESGADSGI